MPLISAFLLATALATMLGSYFGSLVGLMGSLFILFFYRDPDRTPLGDGMVSPADGRVIEALPDRIVIFMSYSDVHVNRTPLDGVVRKVDYKSGSHVPAYRRSASKNEQNRILIETEDGVIDLVQIAGAIVRKIVCYVKPGDYVKRGQRVGMIRLGSRVEVSIPDGYTLSVDRGAKIRAGETIIAVKNK
jgi:phosphatidylserine decarboxylase